MRFILVRHVETVGNIEHRFNGHTESDYTERGLRMKEILIDALCALNEKSPFDRIYTSPTLRAKKIAEAVGKRIGLGVIEDDVLKEFHFGIFDGLTAKEAREKTPDVWEQWMADYTFFPLPGGEQAVEYHERQSRWLSQLDASPEDVILVVGHGGTVHGLMMNLLGLPLIEKWHFDIPLGGIVIIDVTEGFGVLRRLTVPDYPDK